MVVPVPLIDPTTQLRLPPGFRFYPTDEELMLKYLYPKVAGYHFPLQIIGDVDLYKFDPWDLPSKATFGEKEWYFFSPRDRKYPNGCRPNRVAGSGYWKATGTDKVIMSEKRKVGIKKALVFYVGKAPRGLKTNWIMHEYRLSQPSVNNNSLRLDNWVLCRIYKKNSSAERTIYCGSPSSSSSQFDDSLSANIPINDSMNTLYNEDHKDDDSGNYNWMSVGAFALQDPLNSSFVDPTFEMQVNFGESLDGEVQYGIRNERRENSGSLFSQRFTNASDPFAICYPTRQSSLGYELGD